MSVAFRGYGSGWRGWLGPVGFVGTFAAVLCFFLFVNVHDRHFFNGGYGPIYNLCRILFTAYLFWLIVFAGLRGLAIVASEGGIASIPPHERIPLGFFAGAAVITVVMLMLGYLSLYVRWAAAAVALLSAALSYRHFVSLCRECVMAVEVWRRGRSALETTVVLIAAIAAVLFAALLLLVKGLYPQGGHDYFLHYSQFYSLVMEKQGIWPNQFWYHYYYSKGLGVTFLAMLLTDALAPSLAAFCFSVATAMALFSLVQRGCRNTLWPWITVIVYFALYMYTPGTGPYRGNGGWGHFQKPHELNSPMLIGILWLSAAMATAEGAARRAWWWAAAACSFAVAFILIVSSAIVGAFFGLAFLCALIVRRRDAWAFFSLGVVATGGLVTVLVVNYLTTGLPSDIGLNLWWPFLDLVRLDRTGVLYDAVFTAVVRSEGLSRGLEYHGLPLLEFLINATRFDMLWLFIIAGVFALLIGLFGRPRMQVNSESEMQLSTTRAVTCILALLFSTAVVVFGAAFGRTEPISYVRVSSYAFSLVLALTALAWQFAIAVVHWPAKIRLILAFVLPVVLGVLTLQQVYSVRSESIDRVVTNALRFASGKYSIYQAYRDQAGWPAVPPSGGIYPPVYEAWKAVAVPGKRLWSFHVHAYCMVPGCHVESHQSSNMSAERDTILLGSPEEAREALHRSGIDYFFISTSLDIRDPMICTPLFAPDTIAKYMGVKWSDGSDVLLTWKGSESWPLSEQWVEKYRAHLKSSKFTPDCSAGLPSFTAIGHRVHQELVNGKRWGRDVPLPR